MNDREKTRNQLIEELAECRRRLGELERTESEREHALRERVKELRCLYAVQQDMQEASSTDELCQRIIEHLIPGMQHPTITVPVIELDDRRWAGEDYTEELSHGLHTEIEVDGERYGMLRVYYTEERPFLLPEEQDLIDGIAEPLGLWLERKRAEEEQRSRWERMLAIINNFPELLYVVDPETYEVIFVNEVFEQLLGRDPVGELCYEAFQGFDEPCDFCTNETILRTGEPCTWEYHNPVLERDYLVTDQIIHWPDGRDVRFEIAIDITKRKRAEALASKTPVLRGVNRIFREALGGETEEELAKSCLEIAEDLTESRFGFICELNQRGRLDTVAISDPGWDECLIEDSDRVIMAQDLPVRGIRGRVIKDGEAMIFNDPSADPDWIEPPEGHPPVTSFMGVPLEDASGRTMGMIGLGNKAEGYDEDDQEAVEALSVAIVQALERKRLETTLARQAQEILEISTPTMQVWDGVIASPLIGTLDSDRTQRFMEDLLTAIVETGSEIALVDITGVPTIDTLTAQHLVETIEAVRLLGAEVILTGVRPSIAQTLVQLGIDLTGITTRSSLAAGLRVALDVLGLRAVGRS